MNQSRQIRHALRETSDEMEGGFIIRTSDPDAIESNAKEKGMDPSKLDWDKLSTDLATMERNVLRLIHQKYPGITLRDEGHSGDVLVGSIWVVKSDKAAMQFVLSAAERNTQYHNAENALGSGIYDGVNEPTRSLADAEIQFMDIADADYEEWEGQQRTHITGMH